MTNLIPKRKYLDDTLALRQNLEEGFISLGERFKKIRDERLYEGVYDSFKEFLDEARTSEATASKLITIYEKLVEGYNFPRERLAMIGWSSAYEIAKYSKTKKEAGELISIGSGARRSDLQDEIRERKTGCSEHQFNGERLVLKRCITCGKWVREYDIS